MYGAVACQFSTLYEKNEVNINQKFVFAVVSVLLSFTGIEAKEAQAAIVTDYFTVDVGSGVLAGQIGSGSFSYDDSLLTNSGLETTSVQSLSFSFLGNIYTQDDDYFSNDGYPTVDTNNGNLVGLDYTVNYNPSDLPGNLGSFFYIAGTPDLSYGVGGATFYEGNPSSSNTILDMAGIVTYSYANPVPEPSPMLGILTFGTLVAGSVLLRHGKNRNCNFRNDVLKS